MDYKATEKCSYDIILSTVGPKGKIGLFSEFELEFLG